MVGTISSSSVVVHLFPGMSLPRTDPWWSLHCCAYYMRPRSEYGDLHSQTMFLITSALYDLPFPRSVFPPHPQELTGRMAPER